MMYLVFYGRSAPCRRAAGRFDPSPFNMSFVGSVEAGDPSACYRRMRGAAARRLGVRAMRPGDLLADESMTTLFVKQRRGWHRADIAAIKAALPFDP